MGVGLFEEGGFLFGRGGGIFLFFIAASDSFWGGMVVEQFLNCDNSSIVVGRFCSCSCSAAVTAVAPM